MSDVPDSMRELHAVLIGAACYLSHSLEGGGFYPSLQGCVDDVNRMETFLTRQLGVPKCRIHKLTADNVGEDLPPEPSEFWPTYENMVSAVREVRRKARRGSQVLIHYSGHGGRIPTRSRFKDCWDETLVPVNIGDPQARHLRDVEIAKLLHEMVEKGIFVILVLDCCHSGGALRGMADLAVRGIKQVDATDRPTDSLVASAQELELFQQARSSRAFRGSGQNDIWLPHGRGYVALTACRANEQALEYSFGGDRREGALTHWLLDTLWRMRSDLTYKELHDRVLAKVHGQFRSQTPLLEGEVGRVVFQGIEVKPRYAVNVLRLSPGEDEVLLQTGESQGIRNGARFAVFDRGRSNRQEDRPQAEVEIVKAGSTSSWARIREARGSVKPGNQAVLLDPGPQRLLRTVRVVSPRPDTALDYLDALEAVKSALESRKDSFIELIPEGVPDFHLAVSEAGELEIWGMDREPLPNLNPPLSVRTPAYAAKLVDRLTHLARFLNILQVENKDPDSPLRGAVQIEVGLLPDRFKRGDPLRPWPVRWPGNKVSVPLRKWICITLRNRSSRVLNMTPLDLGPDWSVGQPFLEGRSFVSLEPDKEKHLPIWADLPKGFERTQDIVKVFATSGAADFRWLMLPSLDRSHSFQAPLRGPSNDLERMLAALTVDIQALRKTLEPSAHPSRKWTVNQVEIEVFRPS